MELSHGRHGLLIAGALCAGVYFAGTNPEEAEIRRIADALYRRVDWAWATGKGVTLTHGWMPENGFLPYRWRRGYSEAILLYLLALGSPTHPIPPRSYAASTAS